MDDERRVLPAATVRIGKNGDEMAAKILAIVGEGKVQRELIHASDEVRKSEFEGIAELWREGSFLGYVENLELGRAISDGWVRVVRSNPEPPRWDIRWVLFVAALGAVAITLAALTR